MSSTCVEFAQKEEATLVPNEAKNGSCNRCKAPMQPAFQFCVNCGLARQVQAPGVRSQPESRKLAANASTVKSSPRPQNSGKSTRLRQSPKAPRADTVTAELDLPPKVIEGINNILSKPVLNNAIIARRLAQQYQTIALECQNAEGVEIVANNRIKESVALKTSTISPSVIDDGHSTLRSVSTTNLHDRSVAMKRKRLKRNGGKVEKSAPDYLSDVESVATHYSLYMKRLKQLEGLRAALMDPPPLASQVLKERDELYLERKVSEEYNRLLTQSQSLLADDRVPTKSTKNDISTFAESSKAALQAETEVEHASNDVTAADSASTIPGMAFMWGPIFNIDASESLLTAEQNYQSEDGVVRLDASQILGEVSRSLGPVKSKEGSPQPLSRAPSTGDIPKQDLGSRVASPSSVPAAAAEDLPAPTTVFPEAAPVVMFWGNVLNNELRPDTPNEARLSRTSSARLSPSASFSSLPSSHGSDNDESFGEGAQGEQLAQDPAEAELPVWIETLAAETAEIREEFNLEDEEIMRKVGDRLSRLDAVSMRLMSKRALMVQYSMDGVVREYRQKIERMKENMHITSSVALARSRPSTAAMSARSDKTDKTWVSGRFSPLGMLGGKGDLEETRAEEEEQGKLPDDRGPYSPIVVREGDEVQDSKGKDEADQGPEYLPVHHSVIPALRNQMTMDRGQIFEVIEEQETMQAAAKEQAYVDDEALMQELILSLTKAHIQKERGDISDTSNPAPMGPKESAPLSVASITSNATSAERTIGDRLLQQEHLETSDVQHKNTAEESDDLALQHWLVAVSAFDAQRARRATLRTLHMEEMEDSLAGSGDEDDESVGSPSRKSGKLSVSSKTLRERKDSEDQSTELAPATIEVPENHSLTRIKALYRQSCSKMLALLPGMEVDFTIDQTAHPDFRTEARSKVLLARKVLKVSSGVDHKVAVEYRTFLDHCALRRTALTLRISEAMQQASELEKSYRERYAQAKREFKNSADAILAESSDTVKQVSTSKHMRAIQKSAEVELEQQGKIIKELQANEAKLLLDIRQEQYVLSEVLNLWQARHSRILSKFSVAYKRYNGLLDSYRAPKSP